SERWVSNISDSIRHGPLQGRLHCPYSRTISAVHLLRTLASPDRDVEEALRGKMVFYGAGFQMAGDIVVSPVYHALPAVYLHAMAYDNLRTLRTNYKREEQGTRSMVANCLLLLFIVTILVHMDALLRSLRQLNRYAFLKCFTLDAALLVLLVPAVL